MKQALRTVVLLCSLLTLLSWTSLAFPADAPLRLKPEEAASHIGEAATVCGAVVWAKNTNTTRGGQGTFLNLDRPYPHHIFTVIIWEKDRAAFGEPEKMLLHKLICVSGKIEAYKGKPEIVATSPMQIQVQPPPAKVTIPSRP